MLTTSFLVRACAAHKPVNFINLLFHPDTVIFSIKEVCALSLVPPFIVLLLKGCLGLLQDLLYDFCGRFIDFQQFGFYGSLGHASSFLRLFSFSLLPTSLIILHTICAPFSESAQFYFLLIGLTSFPCAWILLNNGFHLHAIQITEQKATEHLL